MLPNGGSATSNLLTHPTENIPAFPYEFITKGLPQENCEMVVLDPVGRQFIIKFVNARKQMGGLNAGWKSFCIANNLEEDDAGTIYLNVASHLHNLLF
ncbi:hypothetical protein ACLOJK_038656 [Asimina triloba]